MMTFLWGSVELAVTDALQVMGRRGASATPVVVLV